MDDVVPRPRELVEAASDNELLVYASAIAFRVLFAIVPFVLFLLALLGLLGLEEVWRDELAPGLRDAISPDLFRVIDDTVRNVLSHRQLFWATLGALIALWEISAAVRATMHALDRIYDPGERSTMSRFGLSILLAVAVGCCFVAAAAIVRLGPLAVEQGDSALLAVALFVVRWGLAVGFLGLAAGLLVRYAPATHQPVRWVSFGSALCVVSWAVMSALFGWYMSSVASYGSTFGSLASVIVLMSYVYLSAIVFLLGAQADALVRREVEGSESGAPERSPAQLSA